MIVYEDGACTVVLREEGAVAGHLSVEPRRNAATMQELSADEAEHLLWVANACASALFEGLGAHGTNILLVEGEGKLGVQVLPRFQDDGLKLQWDAKRADPSELEEIAKRVRDQLWYVGKQEERPAQKVAERAQTPTEHVEADPKTNYKLRQLFRSP